MGKLLCVAALCWGLVEAASGGEFTYKPSVERKFSGASQTYARRAEYLEKKFTRIAESLDRNTCSPSRESLLKNTTGKAHARAVMVVKNWERAERLAAR